VGESIEYNFKLRMTEKSSQMDGWIIPPTTTGRQKLAIELLKDENKKEQFEVELKQESTKHRQDNRKTS